TLVRRQVGDLLLELLESLLGDQRFTRHVRTCPSKIGGPDGPLHEQNARFAAPGGTRGLGQAGDYSEAGSPARIGSEVSTPPLRQRVGARGATRACPEPGRARRRVGTHAARRPPGRSDPGNRGKTGGGCPPPAPR